MAHLFADDIDEDLYGLIRATSVEGIYELVRTRERLRALVREVACDLEEEEAYNAPTESPSSDTMPVSYVAPTSKPAKLAG